MDVQHAAIAYNLQQAAIACNMQHTAILATYNIIPYLSSQPVRVAVSLMPQPPRA
jgi:hypothetical protein